MRQAFRLRPAYSPEVSVFRHAFALTPLRRSTVGKHCTSLSVLPVR